MTVVSSTPRINVDVAMKYDIAIIGAGILGLSTAYELAQRGHSVLLLDRFGSGHSATSSTGASRSI